MQSTNADDFRARLQESDTQNELKNSGLIIILYTIDLKILKKCVIVFLIWKEN